MRTVPRRARACHRRIAFALGVGLAIPPAHAGMPVAYSTTISKPDGAPAAVAFTGTVDGRSVKGSVNVDGVPLEVDATLDGEEIHGTLRTQAGKQFGTISGRRGIDGVTRGSLSVGAVTQAWELPPAGPTAPSATTAVADPSTSPAEPTAVHPSGSR